MVTVPRTHRVLVQLSETIATASCHFGSCPQPLHMPRWSLRGFFHYFTLRFTISPSLVLFCFGVSSNELELISFPLRIHCPASVPRSVTISQVAVGYWWRNTRLQLTQITIGGNHLPIIVELSQQSKLRHRVAGRFRPCCGPSGSGCRRRWCDHLHHNFP